jgi:hypothetical protein
MAGRPLGRRALYSEHVSWIPLQALRLVASHWPVLLTWYLLGYLAHYLILTFAAFVGSVSAVAAFFILPLAVLARLMSFVLMFLALRGGMVALQAARREALDEAQAATSPAPASRFAQFWDILTVSILPLVAFYAAWGFLTGDLNDYAAQSLMQSWGPIDPIFGRGLTVGLNWLTIGITVAAFIGRTALKRGAARLPSWTRMVAAYLETVWVFLTAVVVSQVIGEIGYWISTRSIVTWWESLRVTLLEAFAPLAFAWDAVDWLIAETTAIVLLPLAWLTIAGVVYGRAIAAQKLAIAPASGRVGTLYGRARTRVGGLPQWVRARGTELGNEFVGRFKPLTASIVLIWRAGAIPLGLFVLSYSLLEAGGAWLGAGLIDAIGPHGIDFWYAMSPMLVFIVALAIEPFRIALIAAAYDHSLAALEQRRDAQGDARPIVDAVAGTARTTADRG